MNRAFYERGVVEVARNLVGCVLRHGETAGVIVETEAYHESEPACHAHVGLTGRTLSQLSREELERHSEALDDEFYDVLAQHAWLESKVSEGGTALDRVREQLAHARAELDGQPA